MPGLLNHIEGTWEEPALARHCRRLASFSRLILFDKRGSGMSDRVAIWDKPTLEQRMDDISAVMDAAGSERAALFATADGTPVAMLFAATYPEQITALILYAASARILAAPDHPIGMADEIVEIGLHEGKRRWGDATSPTGLEIRAPSLRDDVRWPGALARMQRLAVTPAAAEAYWRMNVETEVRTVLGTISVPTLILHTSGDLLYPIAQARYVAEHIPGARLVDPPGTDHLYWSENGDAVADEIEEFLSGSRSHGDSDRVLATVLFTDIVDSTATAVGLGDRRWRDLLDSHDHMVRRSSIVIGARRSSEPETGSWRPSTGRAALSNAPAQSATVLAVSTWRSGPESIPARSRLAQTISGASLSTLLPASRPNLRHPKCWSREPSKIWSPDLSSISTPEIVTS
jgi:pimeloyl-ACP methyl ester carboxylesterase